MIEMIYQMASDRLWIYTAIVGALFGAAFLAYFRSTHAGIYLYMKFDEYLDKIRDYLSKFTKVAKIAMIKIGRSGDGNQIELNIETAKDIVIYSSGSFGQHLISSLRKLNHYNIVSWIDEDHIESQIFGLEVKSINHILEIDFDLVLIASIDEHYSNGAISKLVKLGIPRNKISFFKLDLKAIEQAIIEIGFDLKTFNYKDQIYGLKQ